LYADTYQRFLPKPQTNGPELRMLEIGIQSGGSARTWKQFYDEQLYYVGIDVNPLSRRTDNHSESIYVEIGSQSDYDFLRSVCVKHGPFDVIIDDGGHTAPLMRASIEALFPSAA
jgi:hypothetical protein